MKAKHPNGDWKHKMSGPDDQGSNAMHANMIPTNATRKGNTAPVHKTRHAANGSYEAGC